MDILKIFIKLAKVLSWPATLTLILFYIHKNYALFGYVYWLEKDDGKKNKIWASALTNSKGKSKYFIMHDPSKVLFVNLDLKERIEE